MPSVKRLLNRYCLSILMVWTAYASGATQLEWEVQFGWSGGYGNDPGIYINSKGTVGSRTSWRRGDVATCLVTLHSSDISRISKKVAAIPAEIPANSDLGFYDRCYDEREHIVAVIVDGQERSFRYSQNGDCLEGTLIPGWLSDLVEELTTHYEMIKSCETDAQQGAAADADERANTEAE